MSHAIELNFAGACEEARKQIDKGLIQGAVFAVSDHPEIMALGMQTVHPEARKMTPASRFDVASTGKTYTAACCALLHAKGLLELDVPFTRYLPEHALGKDCQITIRDLAMHVSGFDAGKPYQVPDMKKFHEELLRKMPVRPRLEKYEYACYNFILLGLILEKITGKDLDTLAKELIWHPLNMTHTQWNPPGDGPDEVEHWFPNRPAGQHNDDACFFSPAPLGSGSCFSTIGDTMLFLQDIIDRKQFPAEYYQLITTCVYDRHERRSFGWDMTPEDCPACFSDQTIIHSGWTGQTVCVDIKNKRAAAVFTSRTGDWQEAYDGRLRIIEKIYEKTNNSAR